MKYEVQYKDGAKWLWEGTYNSKETANRIAKTKRENGWKVRVIEKGMV